MTIEEQVVEKLRDLPPEKQKEVLEFVDALKENAGKGSPAAVCWDCGRT